MSDKSKIVSLISVVLIITIMCIFSANSFGGEINKFTLWGKARFGMTENELCQAFKGKLLKPKNPGKYKGVYVPYILKNIRIGRHNFKVLFQFGNTSKKLKQVLVVPITKGLDALDVKHIFEELKDLLIEKYGPVSHKKLFNSSLGVFIELYWFLPEKTITVWFGQIGSTLPDVRLAYRKRKTKENI